MQKKNILIAHNYTKNSFANMSYMLAHYLANKGHKVIFMSHNPFFEKPIYEPVKNGELIVYSWSNPSKRPTGVKDFIHFAKIYLKHKPEICIGHFAGANITSTISKLFSYNKAKVFNYYHTLSQQINIDSYSSNFKRNFLKFRKKIYSILFVDYFICPSILAKDNLLQQFGIKKTFAVLNPVEDRFIPNQDNASNNDIILSFLGRIDFSKGVLEMVEAFKKYQHKHPSTKIKLNIAGGGSNIEMLKELIKNNSAITYFGVLPYENVDDYISNSRFIIIPSKFDALNMVGIESLMLSKPLLISKSTGLTEYLNDNSCFKFNSNVEEITNIFKRVEFESYDYNQMCVSARKTYEDLFTIEKYCETMYKLITN